MEQDDSRNESVGTDLLDDYPNQEDYSKGTSLADNELREEIYSQGTCDSDQVKVITPILIFLQPQTQVHYISREELMEICCGIKDNIQAGFDKVVAVVNQATAPLQGLNPTTQHLGFRSTRRWKPKITNNPVRRPISRLKIAVSGCILFLRQIHLHMFQRDVRKHLLSLVGEDTILKPMVAPEVLEVFARAWNHDNGRRCNPCCTIEDFKIDLLGAPRSPWNKSAAKIFCQDFIRHYGLEPTIALVEDIEGAFHTRIKSLKDKLKRHRVNSPESCQETQKNRRRVRKSLVTILSHFVYGACLLTLIFSYSTGGLQLLRCIQACKSTCHFFSGSGWRACPVTNQKMKTSLRTPGS